MTSEADLAKLEALRDEKKNIEQKSLLLSYDNSFDTSSILTDYKTSTEDEVRDMQMFLDEKSASVEALRNQLGKYEQIFYSYLSIFLDI